MNMPNIFVFSKNLKISFFSVIADRFKNSDGNIFITTHFLFENEKKFLDSLFYNTSYYIFSDFISDEEAKNCDVNSFDPTNLNLNNYYLNIQKNKNLLVLKKISNTFLEYSGFVLSNDLGIDDSVWLNAGFTSITGDYFYNSHCFDDLERKKTLKIKIRKVLSCSKILKKIYHLFKSKLKSYGEDSTKKTPIPVEFYSNNEKKYIFIGKLQRLLPYLNVSLESNDIETKRVNDKQFYTSKENVTYIMSMHEGDSVSIPDSPEYDVRFVQDGYLPPNYTALNLRFKPVNVKYYALDKIGKNAYDAQNVPAEILPLRKKNYLPIPDFSKTIQKILVTATCAGPWSALINPSDDDILLEAVVESAKKYPDITFVYRPHPACVHPMHTGVNTINRIAEYFEYTKLHNLKLSTNVPRQNMQSFSLTFSNATLLEDINTADLVISEYSHSLIEGAEVGKAFATVNLTKRRNFYQAITDLGFPHCESVKELWSLLDNIHSAEFVNGYKKAIDNYNVMLDMEE